ncbi:MAG: PIN domain protein [Candidatus Wallbacteria bacterium]|nr:PIN domain protein [Candidatus Wallbacteria bacterium]
MILRPRIYIDTSVIGGCLDDEFREHSLELMDRFAAKHYIAVVSDLTKLELRSAPAEVRNLLVDFPHEAVELNASSRMLADEYLKARVITRKQIADASHIAVATICRVDVLVSWNFKHIVNLPRIHGFNSINVKFGFPMLEIRSPREVLDYEK